MEHINTLKTYKNLIASGVPEQQAEAHVYALNSGFDSAVTTDVLTTALNKLEYDLKMFFVYLVAGTLITLLLFPLISKWVV